MTDESGRSKAGIFSGLSEEKLLGVLLLGLGVLLLLVLLVWRYLNQPSETALAPTAASKHSVWFNKDGPVLSDASTAAVKSENASVANHKSKTSTDGAMGRQVTTVDLSPTGTLITKPVESQSPAYWVQLASFSQLENADVFAKKVSAFAPSVEVASLARAAGPLSVVRVPVLGNRNQAETISEKLAAELGIKPLVVKADP